MIKAPSAETDTSILISATTSQACLKKMMSQRELAARKAVNSAYISSVIKGNVALIEPHLFNMVQ